MGSWPCSWKKPRRIGTLVFVGRESERMVGGYRILPSRTETGSSNRGPEAAMQRRPAGATHAVGLVAGSKTGSLSTCALVTGQLTQSSCSNHNQQDRLLTQRPFGPADRAQVAAHPSGGSSRRGRLCSRSSRPSMTCSTSGVTAGSRIVIGASSLGAGAAVGGVFAVASCDYASAACSSRD
jgi:hypothetical protein